MRALAGLDAALVQRQKTKFQFAVVLQIVARRNPEPVDRLDFLNGRGQARVTYFLRF
jgi:hypothetical protein